MMANHTLLFTGHLIDQADRETERFPPSLIEHAGTAIQQAIAEIHYSNPRVEGVCSLGAGGDMLFAMEMLKRKLPVHIFLPFDKRQFMDVSVSYFKGVDDQHTVDWAARFDEIMAKATTVTTLEENGTDLNAAFSNCNEAMLRFVMERNTEGHIVSAIALMKKDEPERTGGTVHFVNRMLEMHIPVNVVWPDHRAASRLGTLDLKKLVPVFLQLENKAIRSQGKWKKRLQVSLYILATIAFFDAFVTAPDSFFGGYGKWVRIFSLLVSVTGAFLTLRLQLSDRLSHNKWTQNRAKAEQIRSEIWFYLLDFWTENNRSGAYTEDEFEIYIEKLCQGSGCAAEVNRDELVALKRRMLGEPVAERKRFYLDQRLVDQQAYFQKKADYFMRQLLQYKKLTLLFTSVSVSWGVLKMLAEFISMPSVLSNFSPLGMMISFIALVSTYVEANGFKELEYRYSVMAEKIKGLIRRFEQAVTADQFDELVLESEAFLRAQNNEWSIKRDEG